jgi:hypothetical protein
MKNVVLILQLEFINQIFIINGILEIEKDIIDIIQKQ